MSGIFAVTENIDAQMKRFHAYRNTELGCARAKQIFELGEKLIECAKNGQMRKFQQFLATADREDILTYFVVKMVHAALVGGHLMLAGFIIDNGFPISKSMNGMPSCFHEALKEVDDERAKAIVEYLIIKGADINMQAPPSWDTPLHIAIRRRLYLTCSALVAAGADVNAVAKGDLMPLNLAEASMEEDEAARSYLIQMLADKGAKRSWRRAAEGSSSSAGPFNRYQSTSFCAGAGSRSAGSGGSATSAAVGGGGGTHSSGGSRTGTGVGMGAAALAEAMRHAVPPPAPAAATGNQKVSFSGGGGTGSISGQGVGNSVMKSFNGGGSSHGTFSTSAAAASGGASVADGGAKKVSFRGMVGGGGGCDGGNVFSTEANSSAAPPPAGMVRGGGKVTFSGGGSGGTREDSVFSTFSGGSARTMTSTTYSSGRDAASITALLSETANNTAEENLDAAGDTPSVAEGKGSLHRPDAAADAAEHASAGTAASSTGTSNIFSASSSSGANHAVTSEEDSSSRQANNVAVSVKSAKSRAAATDADGSVIASIFSTESCKMTTSDRL